MHKWMCMRMCERSAVDAQEQRAGGSAVCALAALGHHVTLDCHAHRAKRACVPALCFWASPAALDIMGPHLTCSAQAHCNCCRHNPVPALDAHMLLQ